MTIKSLYPNASAKQTNSPPVAVEVPSTTMPWPLVVHVDTATLETNATSVKKRPLTIVEPTNEPIWVKLITAQRKTGGLSISHQARNGSPWTVLEADIKSCRGND